MDSYHEHVAAYSACRTSNAPWGIAPFSLLPVCAQLVTVWSAPNYCYRCGNVAAILEFDEHLTKGFKVFEAAPQDASAGQGQAKKTVPDYFL